MELIIQLPANYPLGVVEVSSVRRLGVSEQEWRNWLIQLTTYLTHQNGSILQSLQIWKRNVDNKFRGVDTVLGLMGKRLGRVPIPGATIDLEGWRLTAEQGIGRRNRISSVLAVRLAPAEEAAAPGEEGHVDVDA